MSASSLSTAGILLIAIVAIEYGGVSLLRLITARTPGYLDNPVRQNLFRAGHAHAGVLVILALVGMLSVDRTGLSSTGKELVRWGLTAAPILMPLGFFLSIAPPRAQRPNALIGLVYLGAVVLAAAVVTLGINLL